MENNPLEKFIKTIKTGSREEAREAQKSIGRYWHNSGFKDREKIKKAFSIFLDEIKMFEKIKDIDHKAYFISVLKWPILSLGEEYFEQWEEFILKQIQNESGKIRQAIIRAAEYLMLDIAYDLTSSPKLNQKEKERNEKNKDRFCNFARKIELLLEKYDEPRFSKYKKISAIPTGIFKSLQILIVEHVLRSEFYKKLYTDWLKKNWNQQIEPNKDFPGETSAFSEYINYHKSIDWQDVKNKEDQFIAKSGKILEKEYPIEEKKKLIFILAHLGTIECYKALNKYLKNPDKELRQWAEIAFDECKNFLESDLKGEDQISVMVGAGKERNRLRFYFVLSHHEKKDFTDEEMKTITQSIGLAAMVSDFVLEDIFIKENYVLISALHTADQAPATLMDRCILACNQGATLVSEDCFVTNTHKPSEKEIRDYLKESQ